MDVKFYEVTLQKLALVSSALSFWRKDDIQLKLKQFHRPPSRRDKEEFLIILIKEVMKKVNSDSLPSVLYSELLLVIKEMGFKMSNWFYYIRRRKAFRNIRREELYDKFLKEVYFTYYGTIDEIKILKLSWMTVPNVDYGILYVMACYYCEEELINYIWTKISEQQLQFYSYKHLCERMGFHLVAYWHKLRENDLEGFFNDCIVPPGFSSVYDTAQSVEVNMFRLSVSKGYVRGVKYFGNKLSKEEIERNVEDCLTITLDRSYETWESQFFRHEQFTEIAFYLSNFLTDSTNKDIFINNHFETLLGNPVSYLEPFLNMFIKIWPWQKCFKVVFKLVEKFTDKELYSSLIFSVIQTIEKNFNLGVTSQSSVSQSQLHQLWYSIPTEWKSFICEKVYINPLLCCDMTSAKLILYDKQFVEKMEGAIKIFIENCCFRVYYPRDNNKDKTKILQDFILTVLISPEWEDDLQDVVRSLYTYVMDGDFDSINKILDGSSKNLIKLIKGKIRHQPVCYYLIKKQEYDVCEQFLNWKFRKENDIVSYKKTFYDDRFTVDHVLDVWMSYKENIEMAKIKSDEFLSWFLRSEVNKMQFKIERLGGKMIEMLKNFRFSFLDDHFEVLEDFFDYCHLNKFVFQLMKEYITKRFLQYSIEDCMKHNLVDKAEKLLIWAFSDAEDEKIALMHRIWTDRGLRLRSYSKDTTEGIVSCKLYIGKYLHRDVFSPRPTREKVTENFKKFIRFFVKPYLEDPNELKHALKMWPDISKRFLEEIDEDERSTATCYSEWPESDDDENYIHCEREYCEWFLEILEKEIPSV